MRQLISSKEDVFREIEDVIDNRQLNWDKLDSVCTGGTPAMIGKVKGFVSLLERFLKRKVFKYHWIIHQEALSAKDMNFSSVLTPVIRCINHIQARALHRREFR
jgi:hypothetical protein